MTKTLYIIDSHSHLYASYYAIPNLSAPDGEPTGATFGYIQAVLKILREKSPDYLVAVFDAKGETFRSAAFADYKITRKPMPEDLIPQVARVKDLLGLLGVKHVEKEGYEADDLIARYTNEARQDGLNVVIVSTDKDLMQLLGPGVTMYDNRRDVVRDEKWLFDNLGITPAQVVDMLALMGDKSDNIPGVAGIGEKRAVALLQQYGTLEDILANADAIKGKMGESIRQQADVARMSRELATLEPEIPVDLKYTDCVPGTIDARAMAEACQKLAFRQLAQQFRDMMEERAEAAQGELFGAALSKPAAGLPSATTTTAAEGDYATAETALKGNLHCVDSLQRLQDLGQELARAEAFAFDTELSGLDPLSDHLVGLSFSTKAGHACYVPVQCPEPDRCITIQAIGEALAPAFMDEKILKVAHNAKFDLAVLRTAGLDVRGPIFDTMIASYLLDAGTRQHSLDVLAQQELGYKTIPITHLIGDRKRGTEQRCMNEVPLDDVVLYAAEDAEVAWRLYELFSGRLRDLGLEKLFHEVEMPLVDVLERMERTGVCIDSQVLKSMSDDFGRRMDTLKEEICQLAGKTPYNGKEGFNVDSPRQLEVVLFDEIGLKPIRKTKTGRSTDSDTLEALAPLHPLPAKVLQYRTLAKLKGTYIDALPTMIHEDGRIHADFNQTVTATGRLSSSNPNLQNIPIRTDEGRLIREAFVPGNPHDDVLLTADYSQIELRLLAHFSQDPFLLGAFRRDLDIHAFVASEIFGVDEADVSSEMRGRAKGVNFGLIYGQSSYGLSKALGISVDEAADYIRAYFARYTRVKQFMMEVLRDAQQNEFVTTILGRRRPIHGIKHADAERWNNPERTAFNTVLQGSAADLIKVAMNRIDARLRQEQRPSRMILQVHDELVFEVPRQAVESEREMIVREMTEALELNVPMKVDVAIGPNWREAK